MKKVALLAVALTLMLTGCGKDKQNELSTDNTNQKTQQESIKTDEKTKDVKKEEVKSDSDSENKDDAKNSKQTAKVLYFPNGGSVVFDKSLDIKSLQTYLNAQNIKFKNTTALEVLIEDGQIKSVKDKDSMSILGTYVGLSDNNTAEFKYNSNSFTLDINEELMKKLEDVGQDILLSLEIQKHSSGQKYNLVKFSKK